MAVKDHHDIDGLIAALRQTMAERDMYGQRALAHAGVVDHRRSVAIFREAVEGSRPVMTASTDAGRR